MRARFPAYPTDDDVAAANRIRQLQRALLEWYRREARDLPWRRTSDPYAIWLSEIILQQTRVDQGLPYYERFLAAFPDTASLAAASLDHVLKLWEGLGYYSRARNLHRCAQVIAEQYAGKFPATVEELLALPGIGPYTAGAIASIAYGVRAPVLDGNVIRVLARVFNLDACTDELATRRELWRMAKTLVPADAPGDFNQAVMELGARICTPRTPRCDECPIAEACQARKTDEQDKRPVRRRRPEAPHQEIVVAVIRRKDEYLLGKRPPTGLLGGLWEFPGGKVEPGETHQLALRREVREELGVEVKVGKLIACVNHAYTHLRVTLNVYACTLSEGEPQPQTHVELKWAKREDFPRFAFPKANHKFLALV